MRSKKLRGALMGCLGIFAFLGGPVPAHATCQSTFEGSVKVAFVSPVSDYTIDAIAPPAKGTFGFAIPVPPGCSWEGKKFTLTYPDMNPKSLVVTEVYTTDLDVYFFLANNTWTGEYTADGPEKDVEIHDTVRKAYVMISFTTPTAHDVPFTFTVT
ncbi:MAG: hypothetical protein ABR548_13675 [Actinomycetota bacterium]|nr:hypothetical protein [Actinomycetota bacterium]